MRKRIHLIRILYSHFRYEVFANTFWCDSVFLFSKISKWEYILHQKCIPIFENQHLRIRLHPNLYSLFQKSPIANTHQIKKSCEVTFHSPNLFSPRCDLHFYTAQRDTFDNMLWQECIKKDRREADEELSARRPSHYRKHSLFSIQKNDPRNPDIAPARNKREYRLRCYGGLHDR